MKRFSFLLFVLFFIYTGSLFSQNQILLSDKEISKLLNTHKLKDENKKKIYIHEIYRDNNSLIPEELKGTYFVFFSSPALIDKSTKEKISSPLVYVKNQNDNQIIDILRIENGTTFSPYYESQSKYGNEYIKFDSKGRAFISVAQYSTRKYGVLMYSPVTNSKKFFPLPCIDYKVFDFEISEDGKHLIIQSQNDKDDWHPRNVFIYDTTTSNPPEQFFEHDISTTSLIHYRSNDQSFCFIAYYYLEPELCGTYVIHNKNGVYSKETSTYYSSLVYGEDIINFEKPLLYMDKQSEKLYAATYANHYLDINSDIFELSINNDNLNFNPSIELSGITIHAKSYDGREILMAQTPLGIRINGTDNQIYTLSNEQIKAYQNEEEYQKALNTELLKNGRLGSSISLLKIKYRQILFALGIFLVIVITALIFLIILYIKSKNKKNLKLEQKQILQIQEEEKAKISRDIHDTVVQDLRAIRVQAESIETQNSISQKRLIEDITNCIVKMRNICYNLTPAELATHSEGDNSKIELISIIDTLCRQFYTKTKIPCSIQIEENLEFPTFKKEVSTNIVRVFQEILNNIEKHSYATKTSVLVRSKTENDKRYLVIFVIDDGVGCDLKELEKSKRKNHFGMQNMKDRMQQIGAQIEFFSMPDEGMKIKLTIAIE